MKERLVVWLLRRFGVTSLRHVHCLFVWVFVTIKGNNLYFYHWTSSINPISPIVKTLCEAFFTCMKHNRFLFESMEINGFWIWYIKIFILLFHHKVYCDPEETIRHELLPILLRKINFYLMFFGKNLYIVTHLDL